MLFEKLELPIEVYKVAILNANDQELIKIDVELQLGLKPDEMKKLQDYFKKRGKDPTDIELQAMGQSWSEHCCYKSSKKPLKKYIFGIDAPYVLIAIQEDAGVVEFDEDHAYVIKMESHNHPSAVEPYGGAATGVGGVIRDVLCMGAQPIALLDPLFFGRLDYDKKLPKGTKHPQYLLNGVVAGIRDYGNRVGIPTVSGLVYFDNGYLNNCLVNAGCVGIAKKDKIIRSRVEKIGDFLIIAGGRTGRDGIHGVNFASRVLTEDSEEDRDAVQLGNPIMKEPLIHATLEANELGLIDGMKDFGGGGLSCVVTELCHAGGVGGELWLEKVPLKEKNMAAWEIWVSESQERMLYAISPENVDKVLEIFDKWDVEPVVVGKTVEGKKLKVIYKEKEIFDMELNFLNSELQYEREYQIKKIEKIDEIPPTPNYQEIFFKVVENMNVSSRENIVRVYDHEVRGATVIKPLQGKIGKTSHGDAAVMKPLEESFKGLAITSAVNPAYTKIDPYKGAILAVEEAMRNLIAVGAKPHSFVDSINFGNPENSEIMGEVYETGRGLGDIAKYFNIPFVSGNVSLYNETFGNQIPPTPTIMGLGIIDDIRKAITTDFKKEGNSIYIIGETKKEMGGSVYYEVIGAKSTIVPEVNFENFKKLSEKALEAVDKSFIAAMHDISDGGLGLTIAEMCFGGDIGAKLDLSVLGTLRTDFKLFSESASRWVVEVKKDKIDEFENLFGDSVYKIGEVGGQSLSITDQNRKLEMNLDELRDRWQHALERYMR